MEKLTKAEEEIMIMIWNRGACTISDLMSDMKEPKPAQTTISSFVRILEKKGYVDHKAYGRTYEYYPIIDKKDYSKGRLGNLVSNYFEGSMNELVSFIVKENKMSLKEMQSLIDKIKEDKE